MSCAAGYRWYNVYTFLVVDTGGSLRGAGISSTGMIVNSTKEFSFNHSQLRLEGLMQERLEVTSSGNLPSNGTLQELNTSREGSRDRRNIR